MQDRGVERDGPAVAVADENGLTLTERADEPCDVGGLGEGVVSAWWFVGVAVAPQIGRDHPDTGRGQDRYLMPPAPPVLRESVEQDDQRAGAGFGDVEPDAVRADVAVRPRAVMPDDRRRRRTGFSGAGGRQPAHPAGGSRRT